MAASAKFWDKIAVKYAKTPIADEAAYQKKLQITREYLQPTSEVLEFGCGTGSTAIEHAPHVKHIHATDISSKMLAIARDKVATAQIDNITFEQASLDDLDIPAQSIDVVLGLSILHLLEDKEAAMAKVYDWLKPDGVFISSTMCLGDNMKFIKWIEPIGRLLGFTPMVKVFTADALESSLIAAGFTIDHRWDPGKNKALFLVAKKSA